MGDWFGGQQPAPNADPSAGLGTQAAAAAMPSQSGLGGGLSGLTSTLSNPLLQGLLGLYGGIAGSPRQEGLGGAIKSGIGGGLGLFNQAQLQQQELPLRQAQLKEAQLQAQKLQRSLQPLTKDQVQGFDNWVATLKQQQQADPDGSQGIFDPMELTYATLLQSQVRGQSISGEDLLKSMTAFKEAGIMQALAKRQAGAAGTGALNAVFPNMNRPPAAQPPGQPAGTAAGAPPAAPAGPTYKLPAGIKLGAGQQTQANVEGLGMTTVGFNGTNYVAYGGPDKGWVQLQP